MKQFIRVAGSAVFMFLAMSTVAFAQEEAAAKTAAALINLTAPFGAALTIIGAGYGISKIGSAAVESMARQPEAAGSISTAMIVSAALIEGVTLFALVVCIIN